MGKMSYEESGAVRQMVYTLDSDEKVDLVSLGMLTTTELDGFLPAIYAQFDEERYIKYDITGLATLESFIQQDKEADLLQIVKALAHLMDATVENMLVSTEILLDKQYLLIDKEHKELRLICLPVVQEQSVMLVDFLKELLPVLLTQAKISGSRIDDTAIWKTVSFLHQNPDASPVQIEQYIQSVIVSSAYEREHPSAEVKPEIESNPPRHQPTYSEPEPTPVINPPHESISFPMSDGKLSRNSTTDTDELMQQNEKAKEKKPFFGLFGGGGRKKQVKKTTEPAPVGGSRGAVIEGMAIPGMDDQIPSANTIPHKVQDKDTDSPMHTPVPSDLLQRRNQTTDMVGLKGHSLVPYLIEKHTGKHIKLDRFPFTIGSDPTQNMLVLEGDNSGYTVSRKHAFIETHNGSYYVIDCGTEGKGSHNGTYLNGSKKRITPNKEYRITHNKTVSFADHEFIFQLL